MPDFTDSLKPQYDGQAILEAERNRSPIQVHELSKHLLSRNNFLERQSKIVSILQNDPLFSKRNQLNMSRPDRFHVGLARNKKLRRLAKQYAWDLEDYKMAEYLTDEMSPYHLQHGMFATSVFQQSSDEQRAEWLPAVRDFKVLGCYAQTELGHGSNVRGVEATATYDLKAQQWVLHSPTLTASKWWNGALGRVATHAVVIAQLQIPKKEGTGYDSHGPHQFLCRIRDEKTHQPLDGIVIGDIGPKYGYASMDNGYMLFDNFRIPHSALLCRYSKVDPKTGAFQRQGHPAIVYGTLTATRGAIILNARLVLARAVTIAIRYTSIRRQFQDRDAETSSQEVAVLDYPTVQIRLLPLLATSLALHYTGEAVSDHFKKSAAKIENGDFSALAEMHALSSGLKSLCTQYAADGIETCRRSMGGHGFHGASGLVGINSDYLSKPTVEGDNWMITQQVASYLIKKMDEVVTNTAGKSKDTVVGQFQSFLTAKKPFYTLFQGSEINAKEILNAFEWRSAYLSHEAYQARIVQKKSWTSLLIQLHKLSRAYSEMVLVTNFFNAIQSSNLSIETAKVIEQCFYLYALYTIDNDPRSFSTTGAVADASMDALPDHILDIMSQIRPHAVKLVDAWAIPDYLLNSALGRYDGKVYEDLFHRAHHENPLNKTTFNPHWEDEEIVLGSGDGGKILSKL
ncbi:acyl-CoA oxidase [Microthyrium microscopicum]|uniref:Acyl-coenzyme A oxidase n=1 Tax=Microthyrium microscopicum TaxID=703497 RepID=A0A6A6UFE5_9PEZI|nr:acyl-CoA oxidase [Microthyrium microscopicum]